MQSWMKGHIITGQPNRPVLFCWLASVVICNAAGGRAGRPRARGRSGGRHCTADQYGYVPLGQHLVEIFIVDDWPFSALKPSTGTRKLPVTNCSSRALLSSSNCVTALQNHWTTGDLPLQPLSRVLRRQSSTSSLLTPLTKIYRPHK